MMRLTAEEEAMLAGEQGAAVRQAMEIVVALGNIYHAADLVPIAHAQVAGVSYKNLGDAGLAFLQEWADNGARVRVPTTLNPAGIDTAQWQALGIPADFARKQAEVIAAYTAMGIRHTLTCAPYQVGYSPTPGEHIAWSESSAVSFANSILGARTNREGGPGALAAAIVGRTARYGLHLDEGRRADHQVIVTCELRHEADFGALGYLIGKRLGNAIPLFRFQGKTPDLTLGGDGQGELLLRALGAAMAASGAVALYHVAGITPEASAMNMLLPDAPMIVISSLQEAYAALNSAAEPIDFVSIGCPHATLAEIAEVARLVRGEMLRARLWVTTSRQTREEAAQRGWVQAIEAAGGFVVADTCVVVAPVELLGARSMATNSAKAAFYAPSHGGMSVHLGPLAQCIHAAIAGRWEA